MIEPVDPISADTPVEPIDPDAEVEVRKWEVWARVELDKQREAAEVVAEMVIRGFPPDVAEELVGRVHHLQVLDYATAADEREQWRAAVAKYRRNMLIGGVYLVIGLVVSVKAWRYPGTVGWLAALIAAAAVAFGLLRFAYGLLGYVRPMSVRLNGQYVPGRRIGTYAPGTPRSRYSRFT